MSYLALPETKRYLRVGHVSDNVLIQSLIDGCEQWLTDKLNIGLSQAAHTDSLDGGGFALRPRTQPVVTITTIHDQAGTSDVLMDSDGYELRAGAEIIRHDGTRWSSGRGRWLVVYSGGHATVPAGVKNVLLGLVFRAYNNRGGMGSEGSESYTVNWQELLSSDMMAQITDRTGSIF